MASLENLKVKLYSDGADLDSILALSANPWVKGFTTNPTLMRKAGILDYEAFAHSLLRVVRDVPVSFEVFADDPDEMKAQAFAIARWAPNVNVKIPVTNREGTFMGPLIRSLSAAGVAVNVTAILTLDQVERVVRGARSGSAGDCVGICGPHRRYRHRSRTADEMRSDDGRHSSPSRVAVGQPA